jgi:hypothetical protein
MVDRSPVDCPISNIELFADVPTHRFQILRLDIGASTRLGRKESWILEKHKLVWLEVLKCHEPATCAKLMAQPLQLHVGNRSDFVEPEVIMRTMERRF